MPDGIDPTCWIDQWAKKRELWVPPVLRRGLVVGREDGRRRRLPLFAVWFVIVVECEVVQIGGGPVPFEVDGGLCASATKASRLRLRAWGRASVA